MGFNCHKARATSRRQFTLIAIAKISFVEKTPGTRLCPQQMLRFFNISNLSVKSFNNSEGYSYTQFIVLDFNSPFSCSELNLFWTTIYCLISMHRVFPGTPQN